jgi:outer membrane lipoprotein carrier protein
MKRIPASGAVFGAILLLAVTLPAPGFAQNPDPLEVLRWAAGRFSAVDALCASFRQELEVPLLDQLTRSRGVLCQQQPNLFSMRFQEPEGDVVVVDGEFLWVYYPSMDPRQVIQTDLGGARGGFDFQSEFLDSPGEKYAPVYEGSEEVEGHPCHVLTLTPRTPSAYESATVWIDADNGLIRRTEIREENGSVRRVILSGLDLSPELESGLFHFTPPPGAQVIRR